MSLHFFDGYRMTPSPVNNNLTNGHESDSENASPSAVIQGLEKELKKVRDELAKVTKEKRAISYMLQQAQDDGEVLKQKNDSLVIALHKATSKINELETLCDKREGEIVELTASLETAHDREGRLKSHLDSSEKECSQLHLEKTLLEEKVSQLEQEVRKLEENELNDQQLLAELELLRTANLELRRDLVAAREKSYRSLAGIEDDEDSPDRMIFDQFTQRTGGVNLRQELIMLGSPLTPTFSRSVQFPSSEDIREEHTEVVTADQCGLLTSASVQTDWVPSKSFAVASTQTTTSNLGNGSVTALQPYYVPYLPHGSPSPNFPQSTFPSSSEPNHDGPSTSRVFWWIWALAVLGLILAIMNNGGRIDITPIVDSCRNGLKFHHKTGIPPH